MQTFGFVFGLSDAIIGLAIFTMGNPLADFSKTDMSMGAVS
jgi:sodium/potassium/calcium exchanger 6